MDALMALPWLSIIVLSPLVAAALLLFIPGSSRGGVRLSVAVTGATGMVLGVRFLQALREADGFEFHLIVS